MRAVWARLIAWWRRPRVLNRHSDDAVLVNDVDRLRPDDLMDIGDGRYIALAEIGQDRIVVRDRNGKPITAEE